MKRIVILLLLVSVLPLLAMAQKGSPILGTWYMIDMSGQSDQRIILSESQMITERWVTYEVDKPYWKEDKVIKFAYYKEDNGRAVVLTLDDRLDGLSPGQLVLSSDSHELNIYNMKKGFDNEENALGALENFKFQELLSRPVYSKERLDAINELPSTEKLSKEELIRLMKSLEAHDHELTEFFTNSQLENAQRMSYYITDNLFKKGLIELGYNPWKPTDEYFIKRLRQDPEIAGLLERQVHFKL